MWPRNKEYLVELRKKASIFQEVKRMYSDSPEVFSGKIYEEIMRIYSVLPDHFSEMIKSKNLFKIMIRIRFLFKKPYYYHDSWDCRI